jgi:hypothetical protein
MSFLQLRDRRAAPAARTPAATVDRENHPPARNADAHQSARFLDNTRDLLAGKIRHTREWIQPRGI